MLAQSIGLMLLAGACAPQPLAVSSALIEQPTTVELFDFARRRSVPVVLHGAVDGGPGIPLAIISHGYGGHATDYSFIASAMVRRGYVVALVEHLERAGEPVPLIFKLGRSVRTEEV